jgi:hypothetical protein
MINRNAPAFSATTSGTATALATQAGITAQLLYVTDISATSSGTTPSWVLYSQTPAGGTTILWQGSGNVNASFSSPIPSGNGNSINLQTTGLTSSSSNISGFYLQQ